MRDTRITLAEAARRIGKHRRTVLNYIHRGLLPAALITPQLYLIDPADLAKIKYPPRGNGGWRRKPSAA